MVSAFVMWELISDFINNQDKVQWNIERTIVRDTNLQHFQIDYFITHTYYECTFRPHDHRYNPIYKWFTKKVYFSRFSIIKLHKYSHIVEIDYYIVDYEKMN